MKKSTKIWLVTASSLVVLGMVIFTAVMTANHWDFSELSTVKYESVTHQVSDEFNSISMETKTENINFLPSDDGKCKVICDEPENVTYSVSVQEKTLKINTTDDRKWYDYIGIMTYNPKITVYLPESEYDSLIISESTGDVKLPDDFSFKKIDISASTGDVYSYASVSDSVKIKLSTGIINLSDISAESIDLSVTTGKVNANSVTCKKDIQISVSTGDAQLTDVSCGSLFSDGSTGDISLTNVIATEKFSIERSTGDVTFDRCDAGEIYVRTTTGDVKGSLLSNKVFIAETGTGSMDIPQTSSGGKCEIYTSTGDIKIRTE